MKLKETFESSESRKEKVIVFVDLSDSTAMKERQAESGWLTDLGWFYDILVETISSDETGNILKFVGDGIMISYPIECAEASINTAINIQEKLREARNANRVGCSCSIGIAAGEVVEFTDPHGKSDLVGTVVDRAARLCSAASPQAVFIDENTTENATWRNVKSRVGEALKRGIKEYKGDLQQVPLRGFKNPVTYHEIFWDTQIYGLKSKTVSEQTQQQQEQKQEAGSELLQQGLLHWRNHNRQEAYDHFLEACRIGNSEAIETMYQISLVFEQEENYKASHQCLQVAAQCNHREAVARLEG